LIKALKIVGWALPTLQLLLNPVDQSIKNCRVGIALAPVQMVGTQVGKMTRNLNSIGVHGGRDGIPYVKIYELIEEN
jgi:hypothetical protein